MKEYLIPVTWQVIGNVKVKADSLEDAIRQAEETPENELPKCIYVDQTLEIQHEYIEEE